MNLLKDHQAAIAELCRAYGVVQLTAFGSVVRGGFGPKSDLDFLVRFDESPAAYQQFGILFDRLVGLQAALESLLNRPVDLLPSQSVHNPYLAADIAQHQLPLFYAA